jgi:hypothetical protein
MRYLKYTAFGVVFTFCSFFLWHMTQPGIAKFNCFQYSGPAISTLTYDEFVEFIPLTGKYDTLQLVTAEVDQLYKDRIEVGLKATTSINNEDYSMIVTSVDSTMKDGRFLIEVKMTEPLKSKYNETIRIRLRMDEPRMAVLLPVGGFYKDTRGEWILVIQDDGHVVKRSIRLGKKNTEHFEVIEGLKVGERVITSSYENFVDDGELDLEAVVDEMEEFETQ